MNENKNTNQLRCPEVVVVGASAGSGKTYRLAKRFLHLLINPALSADQFPLREILAITFTNKATVEMKERILELLKKIALDSFSNKDEEVDILKLLGVSKQAAAKKAKLVLDNIVRHYNFFQVQTIDSFINGLLLSSALGIERSASFKIKRDYTQNLGFCLDLVIEQAAAKKDVFNFLEEFLEHYLFVENRLSWFPKEDILKLMHSLFSLSNKYGQNFHTFEGKSSDVIKSKKNIYQKIFELANFLPDNINAKAAKQINSFLNNQGPIFGILALPVCLSNKGVPMNKDKEADSAFERRWARVHELLKELIELDAKVAYNPYVKLFQELSDFFQVLSKKQDILFLEELNRKARFLFDETGMSVAESYYRLASRFKHYLVDEFQDTSMLQWRNLEEMVKESLSCGGTFFYVGDKKQAIYRFRGGRAELFNEVKEKFNHFNVKEAYLIKNWRSRKQIVDFNNRVFSKDNIEKFLKSSRITEELICLPRLEEGIVEVFQGSHQEYNEQNTGGYVYIERINEKNKIQRDELIKPKVLELIKELGKRFQYQDLAILTRDNNEVELVTSWCLEAGFPVESEKTLNVIENPLIKEIISFLKFLHSPTDDLSFAGFILGEIFAKISGKSNEEITEFICNLRKEKKLNKSTSLYRLFRQKYAKIWTELVDSFLKEVGFVSAYELVVNIYQRFRVMDGFFESQAFFMKFLELIKSKEDDCADLSEFLYCLQESLLEDLYVNVSSSNSIKILTIHKSKGLEFGVVVLPFLRMDINPEDIKGMSSYVVGEGDSQLRLLRIAKNHRLYSPALQKIYAYNYQKACIDELNNIYVALTRPKFELYAFIPKKSGISNNKLAFLIPQHLNESGTKMSYERAAKNTQPLMNISASKYKGWLNRLETEFKDSVQIAAQDKILEGNILHTLLSQIGNCQGGNLETVVKNVLNFGYNRYPFIKDLSKHEEKIRELLGKEEFKSIFFIEEADVFCEKEVVNKFGNLKVIDRLIVGSKKIIIVDYKLSEQNKKEHECQVLEYIEIIKDIYPKHEVEGIIIYLGELKIGTHTIFS